MKQKSEEYRIINDIKCKIVYEKIKNTYIQIKDGEVIIKTSPRSSIKYIEGIVNGGAIAMVEGLRGFIPASRMSLSYIENLEDYLLKDIEVQVIDVDQANNRLVLSARELLKEKEKAARDAQIASMEVGTVLKGTVETLQNYGAFVKLENGLSGLVHVSQISQKRVKMPSDVLTVGDEVEVKVIGIKDGKISLSMKALEEDKEKAEEKAEKVVIPKAEDIGTNLGDLFKNIQL